MGFVEDLNGRNIAIKTVDWKRNSSCDYQVQWLREYISGSIPLFRDASNYVFAYISDAWVLLGSEKLSSFLLAEFARSHTHILRHSNIDYVRKIIENSSSSLIVGEVGMRVWAQDGQYYINISANEIININYGCVNLLYRMPSGEKPLFYRPEQQLDISIGPAKNRIRGFNLFHSGVYPLQIGNIEKFYKLTSYFDLTGVDLILMTWLVDSIRPDSNYSLLQIIGESGSGTSTLQSMLGFIIDPCSEKKIKPPFSRKVFYQKARYNHVLSCDGVDILKYDFQADMVNVLTGVDYKYSRSDFKDQPAHTMYLKRPIIVSSENPSCISSEKLISRTVTINLSHDVRRADSNRIITDFENDVPEIFDGFIGIACRALRELAVSEISISVDWPVQHAQFIRLGFALSKAMGRSHNEFIEQFERMLARQGQVGLEKYQVGVAIKKLVSKFPDLNQIQPADIWIDILEQFKPEDAGRDWPKSPQGFKNQVEKVRPSLSRVGIVVERISDDYLSEKWLIKTSKISLINENIDSI